MIPRPEFFALAEYELPAIDDTSSDCFKVEFGSGYTGSRRPESASTNDTSPASLIKGSTSAIHGMFHTMALPVSPIPVP